MSLIDEIDKLTRNQLKLNRTLNLIQIMVILIDPLAQAFQAIVFDVSDNVKTSF